jgi:hypothetical protein
MFDIWGFGDIRPLHRGDLEPGMQVPVRRGCIWEPFKHHCYKILKNDTMSRIGDIFEISVSELSSYNDITDPDVIESGAWLAIPSLTTGMNMSMK